MRCFLVMGALAAVPVLVTACGGDDTATTSTGTTLVTPQAACDAVLGAICDQLEACAPFYVDLVFGDVASCKADAAPNCAKAFDASGTTLTPELGVACAKDLAAQSCEESLAHVSPASCQPRAGTLGQGTACGDDWQCATAHCAIPADAACGTCKAAGGAGDACAANEDCVSGLMCSKAGKCAAPAPADAGVCDVNVPCTPPSTCQSGKCAPALGDGAACTPGADECDLLHGFACNPTSSTCTQVKLAGAGQACGLVGNDLVLCQGGFALCKGSGNQMGTCEKPVDVGGACTEGGTPCAVPSVCDGDVCTVKDASVCK